MQMSQELVAQLLADFEGSEDQTDDAHLYLDRFSAFIKMLYKTSEEKYEFNIH